MRGLRAALILGIGVLVAGCSYLGSATNFNPEELATSEGWLAVPDVPVIRQKEESDCGVAAISMILGYWSIPCPDQKAADDCPVVPGQGSKAGDLRDCARSATLEAYLIHGEWEDLRSEISLGHPVLIGLVKAYVTGAVTHYEVVVALHPDRKVIVSLDPGHGWRQNSFEGFLREWEATGRLTLVVFGKVPGRPPKAKARSAAP